MTPPPEKIRLVLCISTKSCNANGAVNPLYQRLVEALGEPDDFRSTRTVRWEVANCLDRCGQGPNLVWYPEGRWSHFTTWEQVEAIIAEFLALRQTCGEV